jgi:hypothetical protein
MSALCSLFLANQKDYRGGLVAITAAAMVLVSFGLCTAVITTRSQRTKHWDCDFEAN